MVYVFDSSFAGALIIPDEKNPHVEKMYLQIKKDDTKYVPHLFLLEMANIFMNLIRRKRNTYDEALQLLPVLSTINITVDSETGAKYTEKLLHLCNDYKLSSYDAAYLELAERKKAVLCTMDENLKVAAKKYGVKVLR